MEKRNVVGLGAMVVGAAAVVALTDPVYNGVKDFQRKAAAGGADTVTASGTAEGYGGPITAEVTYAGDKIVGLTLTGEQETPEIGGKALTQLQTSILENQGLEGVDGISGATWTSKGVFAAIQSAMGEAPASAEENAHGTAAPHQETDGALEAGEETDASGLSHGLGIYSTGRLGPGSDDQGVGVYSFNEVVAYVVFDSEDRIVDLQVDQLEVATPNYDGAGMPDFTGFPGQSYHADLDHDGTVDQVLTQTEEEFMAQVEAWKTKRERGSGYKLNSGTWTEEMDLFEELFRGMTVNEIEDWYASYCSDVNGRPLHGTSENEQDIAKYQALSDEEKGALDSISAATMSLDDAHGNIIGAIQKAYNNRRNLGRGTVAKIGLGFTNTGRLGPGSDDTGTGVYSFNTQAAGACYDGEGRLVGLYTDVVEVATPNYDGATMPKLTGFPGQSYNADENHDEKVDAVLEQTEEDFMAQVDGWKTKRERGNDYKLNSGTWSDEMDLFESAFAGMTTEEITDWYAKYCSDVNGRPLHGTSENQEDIAKYNALTQEEKAALDQISGATMSLQDAHGDLLGAIQNAWANAVDWKE